MDAGQRIEEVCREHNLSQVRFYRCKKQFGQMEVNEAKRLKELERENTDLKKMLADSLPDFGGPPFKLLVLSQGEDAVGTGSAEADDRTQRQASSIWLSPDRSSTSAGGMACW